MDVHTGVTVDALYFFDEVQLNGFTTQDTEYVLGVELARGDGGTCQDLLPVTYVEVAGCRYWVAALFTLFGSNGDPALVGEDDFSFAPRCYRRWLTMPICSFCT